MRRSLRAALAMAIAAAAALVLSGCDHFNSDPLAFTVVDDTAIVRFCLPVTVTRMEIKTYPEDGDSIVVWSADGEAQIEGGTELPLGVAPPGLTVSKHGTVDFLNETFALDMDATDAYGPHHFFSYLTTGDLVESEWANDNGRVETPCVRDPCPPGYTCLNQWPEPTGFPTNRAPTWAPTEP